MRTGNIALFHGSCLSSSASIGVEGEDDDADELDVDAAHEGVGSETDAAQVLGASEQRESGGRTLVDEARERGAGRRRDDDDDGEGVGEEGDIGYKGRRSSRRNSLK